jgi:hypothetical protein
MLARLLDALRQVGSYLPAVFGVLLIIVSGFVIARLVQGATDGLLRRIGFNSRLERAGLVRVLDHARSPFNPARIVSSLVFWGVMSVALFVAATALGLDSLAQVFGELVGYVPSVIAAIVIVVIGIGLGGLVSGIILASVGGMTGGLLLARAGRAGVVLLAVFMALQELGVATDIVTTAFAILFGAVALAAALAFGLGNRDLAAEVTREWYERFRAEREALALEDEDDASADDAAGGNRDEAGRGTAGAEGSRPASAA